MSDSFRAARAESEFAGGGIGAPATMGDMDEAAATILVVEDHKATRTFLADNLSADGYELLESDCAATARHLIETAFPDLAIVDLGLPGGASGVAPGGTGLPVQEGVRTAARARRRADSCVHARGAPARGVGLQVDGY